MMYHISMSRTQKSIKVTDIVWGLSNENGCFLEMCPQPNINTCDFPLDDDFVAEMELSKERGENHPDLIVEMLQDKVDNAFYPMSFLWEIQS